MRRNSKNSKKTEKTQKIDQKQEEENQNPENKNPNQMHLNFRSQKFQTLRNKEAKKISTNSKRKAEKEKIAKDEMMLLDEFSKEKESSMLGISADKKLLKRKRNSSPKNKMEKNLNKKVPKIPLNYTKSTFINNANGETTMQILEDSINSNSNQMNFMDSQIHMQMANDSLNCNSNHILMEDQNENFDTSFDQESIRIPTMDDFKNKFYEEDRENVLNSQATKFQTINVVRENPEKKELGSLGAPKGNSSNFNQKNPFISSNQNFQNKNFPFNSNQNNLNNFKNYKKNENLNFENHAIKGNANTNSMQMELIDIENSAYISNQQFQQKNERQKKIEEEKKDKIGKNSNLNLNLNLNQNSKNSQKANNSLSTSSCNNKMDQISLIPQQRINPFKTFKCGQSQSNIQNTNFQTNIQSNRDYSSSNQSIKKSLNAPNNIDENYHRRQRLARFEVEEQRNFNTINISEFDPTPFEKKAFEKKKEDTKIFKNQVISMDLQMDYEEKPNEMDSNLHKDFDEFNMINTENDQNDINDLTEIRANHLMTNMMKTENDPHEQIINKFEEVQMELEENLSSKQNHILNRGEYEEEIEMHLENKENYPEGVLRQKLWIKKMEEKAKLQKDKFDPFKYENMYTFSKGQQIQFGEMLFEECPYNKNPELVEEYHEDILETLMNEQDANLPNSDYLDNQHDINFRMRAILIDWLVEVHHKVKLQPETLFIAVNLIDRYLSEVTIQRSLLQLVGVSSLFIACKYEEIYPPELKDFAAMTDHAYQTNEILEMEGKILYAVGYNITQFSSYAILRLYQTKLKLDDTMFYYVRYLLELSLLDYKMLKFNPRKQVLSSVYIVYKLFTQDTFEMQNALPNEFNPDEYRDCSRAICDILDNIDNSNLHAVKSKFRMPAYFFVADIRLHY